MKVQEKFKLGQRVKYSPEWLSNLDGAWLSRAQEKRFVVKGFSRDGRYVRIVAAGKKTAEVYHPDFIEAE